MSASRIWSNFKDLLDVSWGSIADGQILKRSGTNIIGVAAGAPGAHASTHVTGGGDVIAAPTTSANGLCPALPAGSDPTYVLRGDGAFAGRCMVTATTATFTCPAYFATSAAVSILSASWLSVGDKVFVFGFGQFLVATKASNTSITLFNTGDAGNASSGTVPIGAEVRESGMVNVGEIWAYTYQDHFMTGSDGSYTNWTANGTGATKGQATSTADHPGLFFLTTGTSNGAAATGYAFATTNNAYVVGTGGAVAFRCVILAPTTKPTSTAANLSKIYIGLGTQPANGTFPGADFLGFVFDPSSGMANAANNWGFLSRKASANTFTDTSYAYSTSAYADLSFIFDGTNANYRAYQWASTAQAKSANITSNVPLTTTPLCVSIVVVNGAAGTTSYTTWIDLWEVAYRGPTAVPTFRGTNLLKNF